MKIWYLVLLLPLCAHAWDCTDPVNWTLDVPANECYRPPATTVTQGQQQGQHQGQGQSQSATGGSTGPVTATTGASTAQQTQSADNAGNAQSTSYNNSMPRQTPMAVAGFVQPTSSCMNAINGGASAPIAGLSFGFGHKDRECDLRESAREFYEMGRPDLAIELLCASAAAKHLKNCVYVAPVVAQVPAQPNPKYVTERQLQEVERRIATKETEK